MSESTGNAFTEESLINACANFKKLINNPDALVKNAGNLMRAMYLPVADVQKVLAETKGDYVKVYYGVMNNINGEHFIFMAPGDLQKETSKMPESTGLLESTFSSKSQDVAFTAALPDCIGKIPPCPDITDQFVH